MCNNNMEHLLSDSIQDLPGEGFLGKFLRLDSNEYDDEEEITGTYTIVQNMHQYMDSSIRESPNDQKFEDVEEYPKTDEVDRQKKDNHNIVERRRRYNINDRIKDLGDLLPKDNEPFHDMLGNVRHSKGSILRATVEYVRILKNEKLKQNILEEKYKVQQIQNKKLLLKLREYELTLPSFDIKLSLVDSNVEKHTVAETDVKDEVIVKEENSEVMVETLLLFEDDINPLSRNDPMLSYLPNSQPALSPKDIFSSSESTCSSLDSFGSIDMDF